MDASAATWRHAHSPPPVLMPCVASSAPCAARLGAAPVRRAGGSRRVAAPRRSLAPAARAAVRAPPPPASSASSPSGIDALLAQLSAGLQPLLSSVTAATSGGGGAAAREAAKAELLDAIAGLNRGVAGLNRGVNATDADRAAVDAAARKLERLNPNRGSLASAAINGRWELIYTTSVSILGSNRPPFLRPQGACALAGVCVSCLSVVAVGCAAAVRSSAPYSRV